MKNKLILVLILALAMAFTACGGAKQETKAEDSSATEEVKSSEETIATEEETTAAAGYEYDYKEGVLTQVVDENGTPKQTEFVIDGIILFGNRHSYFGTDDIEGALATFVAEGYKKEGLNSSFYLNEYIQFYVDTKYTGDVNDVKVMAVPHRTQEAFAKLSPDDLTDLAYAKGFCVDFSTPDEENNKFVTENYISLDYPEGKYDLIFTYKGEIAYFIVVDVVKEPTE